MNDKLIKNELLVSVIVPVYNVIDYINDAIESVINQTYQNLEIIIVDDGSYDGSEILCEKYAQKDRRIKLIHQKNKGLSVARNVGLDMMKGDAVVFLDSDDAYDSEFVEKMVEAMIRTESDIVMCKYKVLTTEESLLISCDNSLSFPSANCGVMSRNDALQLLTDGKIDHHAWNKLYSRAIWENIRYPAGRVYEDEDTTFRLIDVCNKMCVINQPLYFYRIRLESITNSLSCRFIDDRLLAWKHYNSFVESNIPDVFSDTQIIKILQNQLCLLIRMYIRNLKIGKDAEKYYFEKLRDEIIKKRDIVEMRGIDIRFKLCLWMIHYCPILLRIVIKCISLLEL